MYQFVLCLTATSIDTVQAELPPSNASMKSGKSKKNLQRSKSLVMDDGDKRMRRTKSAVYEKGMEELEQQEALTRSML